jgi:hypothetical protein
MPDPELLAVDAETKASLEAEARAARMTVPAYVRALRQRSRTVGTDPFGDPMGGNQLAMSGFQGGMDLDSQLNLAFRMRLLDLIGSKQGQGVGREDLVDLVEVLEKRLGKGGNGTTSAGDRIKAILVEKAEIKQLRDLAGDDDTTKRYADQRTLALETELKALTTRMTESDQKHSAELAVRDAALKAEQDKHEREEQERRMADLDAKIMASHQELVDRLDRLGQPGGPASPIAPADVIKGKLDEVKVLVGGIQGLQDEFKKLAPAPQTPGAGSTVWDKASYLLQQFADAGSQLMEGAGAIIAARTGGIPPNQLGRMPGPGADDTTYVPDYSSGSPPPPAGYAPAGPPAATPAAIPPGGGAPDDERLFPRDRMYIDPDGNRAIPREQFIAKYGDLIRKDPSLAREVPVAVPPPQGTPHAHPPAGTPPPAATAPPAHPPGEGPRDVQPNEGRPETPGAETRDETQHAPAPPRPYQMSPA